LIYPDKPVITQGDTFTLLVKGTATGGGSAPGYFGEAYWNLGWFGVLIMSIFVGILLSILCQFNSNMILTKNYQFFPIAFMALTAGYRPDDWLISTTVNSIPFMLFTYVIIKLIPKGDNFNKMRL
jgi:hypothetical protein